MENLHLKIVYQETLSSNALSPRVDLKNLSINLNR